jgi:hypothetical protein
LRAAELLSKGNLRQTGVAARRAVSTDILHFPARFSSYRRQGAATGE